MVILYMTLRSRSFQGQRWRLKTRLNGLPFCFDLATQLNFMIFVMVTVYSMTLRSRSATRPRTMATQATCPLSRAALLKYVFRKFQPLRMCICDLDLYTNDYDFFVDKYNNISTFPRHHLCLSMFEACVHAKQFSQ